MYIASASRAPTVHLKPTVAGPKTQNQTGDTVTISDQESERSTMRDLLPRLIGGVATVGGFLLASQGGLAGAAATLPLAAGATLTGLAGLSADGESGIRMGGAISVLLGLGAGAGAIALGVAGGLVGGVLGAVGLGVGAAFGSTVLLEKLQNQSGSDG